MGAPPAAAHDSLVAAAPEDGAVLVEAPERVVLTFSDEVQDLGLAVVVTAPSGLRVTDGPVLAEGREVVAELLPLTEPGGYTVAYRVVSSDGHPIQGRTSFTLDLPPESEPATPSAQPSAPPSSAAAVAPSGTGDPGSSPPWTWVAVGGVVVVAALIAVAVARSRSA